MSWDARGDGTCWSVEAVLRCPASAAEGATITRASEAQLGRPPATTRPQHPLPSPAVASPAADQPGPPLSPQRSDCCQLGRRRGGDVPTPPGDPEATYIDIYIAAPAPAPYKSTPSRPARVHPTAPHSGRKRPCGARVSKHRRRYPSWQSRAPPLPSCKQISNPLAPPRPSGGGADRDGIVVPRGQRRRRRRACGVAGRRPAILRAAAAHRCRALLGGACVRPAGRRRSRDGRVGPDGPAGLRGSHHDLGAPLRRVLPVGAVGVCAFNAAGRARCR